MIAAKAAGTIPEPPKISCTYYGRLPVAPVVEPSPYPRPRATEMIVISLAPIGFFVTS